MPCYHPKRVALDEAGQLDWSVWAPVPDLHDMVLVPCRKCIGCTASVARDWAIRCYHEASMHERLWKDPETGLVTKIPHNVFLTLTYDEENLPPGGLLRHSDFVKFLKRLRKRRNGNGPSQIRTFMAGEYGGRTGRPHYHAILFGEDFSDRYEVRTDGEKLLQGSFELDDLWRAGTATLDEVNFQTVRYVAGYVSKKEHAHGNFTGPLAHTVDEVTGEITVKPLQAEYRQMSRRPGLGREWIERHYKRVYPADEIVIHGQGYPPPTFYDRWLRTNHPGLYGDVQSARLERRIQAENDYSPERLASAETIKYQQIRQDQL